jgi:hypothetical protein
MKSLPLVRGAAIALALAAAAAAALNACAPSRREAPDASAEAPPVPVHVGASNAAPHGVGFYGGTGGVPLTNAIYGDAGTVPAIPYDGGLPVFGGFADFPNGLSASTVTFRSGSPPGFGRVTVSYGSDADKTLTADEYANHEILVSGTQTFKKLIFPLTGCATVGCEWIVFNNTTLPLHAMGASGTGPWIASASSAYIRSNGTNLLGMASIVASGSIRNDLGTDGGASVVLPHGEDEECLAYGTSILVCTSIAGGTFTDAATWVTVAQYTPPAGQWDDFYVLFEAHDQSGNANGTSLNADAAGGGGFYNTLNNATFKLEAHAVTLSLLPDAGAGAQTYLCAQAGAPCNQTSTASLAPLAITACTGCTKPYDTTGCTCGATTTFTAQAVMSGTTVLIQVKAVGTTSWPWAWKAKTTHSLRGYP